LVRFLTGGERNRLLLARLFLKPANVLVLDEPTNDLDTETLELLEERLGEFAGTLLLVSHDREFLNNVVTSTIVFESGNVREYVGGYDDWLRQRPEPAEPSKPAKSTSTKNKTQPAADKPQTGKRRLAYHEKRDLELLPAKIESLEAEINKLHAILADPKFYTRPSAEIAREQLNLKELGQRLNAAYERWEELESLAE
jgi:ATP-binding cassette subfamily F protein uup